MHGGDLTSGHGVRVGDVLAGKYRVERVLVAGGMGVVVAAHHIILDEKVALKFLLPDARANPDAVARFNREAQVTIRIKNEHVARVFDVGQLENGSPYIVMEYLDGSDLAAWLAQRGPLPIDQAVDFVLQACEAISEAHTLGIVHGDLKPANLFCVKKPDGTLSVKVLNFGISEAVDRRTDIGSLGVILFELVAGRAPAALEAVLARCLEKDPEGRYQTVAEMALALQPFGTSRR